MTKRSNKIIWGITLTIVVMAFAVQSSIMYLKDRAATSEHNYAITIRDRDIEELKALLETDWRLRREPTRQQVQQIARYATNPDLANAEAFFAQGVIQFYAHSDLTKAETALRKSIELKSDWAWSHDMLGIVLFENGKRPEALESIETAMMLAPDWSRPYSDLARLYRIEKKWDKALEYAHTAIEMDKDNPVPLFNYGVILDNMGNRAEAQKVYLKVLEVDAELPAPYYNIACHYARNKEPQEAMNHLAIAIKLGPEFYEESKADSDFDGIRNTPAFIDFMNQHRPD
jgi:tetratricopeptide (TPR) repeat protein